MKILIVDDEGTILDALSKMLKEMGHEPHCANSASEAVRMVESGGFSFAFVDFHMPENNGIWFMKNAKIPKETKVLLMTAHVNREVINEMFKFGARGYLIKPFSEEEIQQHLNFHSEQGH